MAKSVPLQVVQESQRQAEAAVVGYSDLLQGSVVVLPPNWAADSVQLGPPIRSADAHTPADTPLEPEYQTTQSAHSKQHTYNHNAAPVVTVGCAVWWLLRMHESAVPYNDYLKSNCCVQCEISAMVGLLFLKKQTHLRILTCRVWDTVT